MRTSETVSKLVSMLAFTGMLAIGEARTNTVCGLSGDKSTVLRWDGNSWQKIGDWATAIYGGGFALVATAGDAEAWAWSADSGGWRKIGGGGAKFVVTNSAIYGLTTRRDSVFKWLYDGENWEQIGIWTGDIYGGGHNLFATTPDNTETWHYLHDDVWEKVGAGGADFAVDSNGALYGLGTPKDAVYQWTGSGDSWIKIGGGASRVFAGGAGVFAVTPDNDAIYRHISGENWQKVGGGGKEFAVSDEGLYGLHPSGNGVYKWQFDETWNSLGGGSFSQIVPCP